jgi:4-amino-4-deoxy-L-arabinose transferase-like glycosyltransferase
LSPSRIGLTDVPVLFFIVAALYGFVRAGRGSSSVWLLFAWSCLGLGVLTKGPVGVLPIVVWLTFAIFSRDCSMFTRVRPVMGFALAAGIALPWYIVMTVEHGRVFTDFALGHEIVERVISERSFAPSRGFFYYFKVWPGDAAPWSVLGIAAAGWIAWRWSALDRTARHPIILAAAWFVTVFVVFSLARSKIPHYVLPAYPAAALLIGVFVDRLADARADARWWGVPMAIIAVVSLIAAGAFALFLNLLAPSGTLKLLVPGLLGVGAAAIGRATWKLRWFPPFVPSAVCWRSSSP